MTTFDDGSEHENFILPEDDIIRFPVWIDNNMSTTTGYTPNQNITTITLPSNEFDI